MEEEKNENQERTKKNIFKILNIFVNVIFWFLFAVMLLYAYVGTPYGLHTIILILCSLSICPILVKWLNTKCNNKIKKYMQFICFIILFYISMSLYGVVLQQEENATVSTNSDNNTTDTINVVESETEEETETEEEKQARLAQEQLEEEQKEAEEQAKKEQEESDFKASCAVYTYEEIARNPDNFKGTNVKLTGEVVQVTNGTYSTDLRVSITNKGSYYTDTIYVKYYPETGADKILEDDIITIYGTSQGDYTYTSVLGASVTLPYIYAKYITIN